MRKIVLRNQYAPGDDVLLTAAVRDLHLQNPNKFITDIRTAHKDIWINNPYITVLADDDPDVEHIDCHYPLIQQSNYTPHHAIHGYAQYISKLLGVPIEISLFKGDIHLGEDEMEWDSQVREMVGEEVPFWIIVAGEKTDATVKWWAQERFQEVVDHFCGRVQFVQVGCRDNEYHVHPELSNVIDLTGRTSLRQLIRLIYHCNGVLCPVTLHMHLAAAVCIKGRRPLNRACVVVAGGREPSTWEAYPHHQFIHTSGALFCCDNGGCWKSRVKPLGDGSDKDGPEHLCINVSGDKPKCMDMITAMDVCRRIDLYLEGGVVSALSIGERQLCEKAVRIGKRCHWQPEAMEIESFRAASDRYLRSISDSPNECSGRGVVICGGGDKYFSCAWVCIKMLRRLGCMLPVELWHYGPDEMRSEMRDSLSGLDVVTVDAFEVMKKRPARVVSGYGIKAYAIVNSTFNEILLCDADNVPVINPEYLFEDVYYLRHGAMFWPDVRPGLRRNVWRIFGARYRKEPEFESGQMLVDKRRCWRELCLALWYNEHCDFYYRYILGDKDTFHMAFRKTGHDFAFVPFLPTRLYGVLCQHDFDGQRVFQHRNGCKWTIGRNNISIDGFWMEDECFKFLDELRVRLSGSALWVEQVMGGA